MVERFFYIYQRILNNNISPSKQYARTENSIEKWLSYCANQLKDVCRSVFLSLCAEIRDSIKSQGCLRIIRLFMNLNRFSLSKFPLKTCVKGCYDSTICPYGLILFS